MTNETTKQPALIAYSVRESGDNSFYTRIGAAWSNKKGGYGIRLDALPVNGEIVLFPPKEDDTEDAA
ncbi:MAG: hypothetical protein KDN22_03805 [Verrucomicrobiae bacterium]|nr:hypothetical protein [Verrucomicrobiae bacterium]